MAATDNAKSYILQILYNHIGVHKRIKRTHLLIEINNSFGNGRRHITDRTMRILIEELRSTENGKWIVSTMKDGGGYFVASDKKEAEAHIMPEKKKNITAIMKLNNQMKMIGIELSPQMDLF